VVVVVSTIASVLDPLFPPWWWLWNVVVVCGGEFLCLGVSGVVKLSVGLWWHLNSSAAALPSSSPFGFVSHEVPFCSVGVGDS
jgi:hypothetical protein